MQENFINHILDILPNPIITAVIGFFTLYLTRKYNYKSIARERLDHVYHPLFLEIEPFLFKNVTYADIQHIVDKYMELEKDYSLLISPTLRYLMHSIYEKKEVHKADKFYPDDWIVVCKQFSKEYDKLCKYALSPTRNTAYRQFAIHKFNFCTHLARPIFLFLDPSFVLSCGQDDLKPQLEILIKYSLRTTYMV